jgi:Glycosyl hydrolases family 2, TIM barrel domain/Glycosyl hydrolases family 2, sugar binding domain/Glycosyl hydrolases family 2
MRNLFSRAMILVLALAFSRTPGAVAGIETEQLYLSGHGKDDAIPWQFMCTSGAQSGYWTNLVVPSQWEMHGFGTLHYRKDPPEAWNEKGLYRHDFTVPAGWAGRRIFLVFEGVMTDTDAKLNGQSVGPVHQGGFYQFQYEVTKLVKFGETNQLEVTVAKHSANASVNRAERDADYWVFGGIYRPVYLRAVPPQFINRVAIDAQADGNFNMDVYLDGVTRADSIEAQIQTLDGENVGKPFGVPALAGTNGLKAELQTKIASPRDWSAETPNLYRVQVWLKDGGRVLHHVQQQFGFRTMEVRDGDGLYVNGRRVVLKGVNRHSFWPDSGRCLSEAVQRLDVETIKDANMNAVRMSHYPPDASFLEVCDEKGLYVLDELAGWHHYYDNTVGPQLVKEMVTRDVNHPCILFWDNGNEGGFNTNLDRLFGRYDPQHRRVLHPWIPFNGVDTIHYPTYDFVKLACEGYPVYFHRNAYFADTNDPARYIFMPTEFMHGLYDGGAGAGLADVWQLMEKSKYLGGGFIWALLDDGVKRPDTGQIDVAGNQAPDGIVGPYRQREASFYAIKEIWSPIVIVETNLPANFNGTLTVENHFSFTDARQCRFTWQLRRFIPPGGMDAPDEMISAEGVAPSPDIPPGGRGQLHLNLPENFWHTSEVTGGDLLAVRVADPNGRELWTYVWPLRQRRVLANDVRVIAQANQFGAAHRGVIELKGKGLVAGIDGATGRLIKVERNGKTFSLRNGPRLAITNSTLDKIVWQLRDDGWLQCDYRYHAEGTNDYFGVVFDYPENLVKAKKWLGDGPYRVWKNRRQGVTLGVWENNYNNTITGWRGWIYPEFKGCFADVRWLQLGTSEGTITVVPEHVPFVQVLTPEFPPANLAGDTIARLPQCGLGFLNAIPPMGSKFQAADAVAPSGRRAVAQGEYSGTVSFYFGELPPTHGSRLTQQLNQNN